MVTRTCKHLINITDFKKNSRLQTSCMGMNFVGKWLSGLHLETRRHRTRREIRVQKVPMSFRNFIVYTLAGRWQHRTTLAHHRRVALSTASKPRAFLVYPSMGRWQHRKAMIFTRPGNQIIKGIIEVRVRAIYRNVNSDMSFLLLYSL